MIGKRILILFIFISVFANAQVSSVKEIVQRMTKANASLQTSKFTLLSEERLINGKYVTTKRYVKMQVHPKKIYFFSVQPNPGTEILWRDGWLDNKMLVSPKSFPYVTFNLSLTSSIARKDTHHSILDLGFEYVTGLIEYYAKLYGDKFYNTVTITDTVQWDNRSCIVVDCDFKDYAVTTCTVKHGENLMDIADKLHLNDYSILMFNPKISNYTDVKEGQVIKIPNFYARKIEFYIDRYSWLPLRQVIYDNNGLYEKYEMKSLLLNPVLAPEEFTPEFRDYKF